MDKQNVNGMTIEETLEGIVDVSKRLEKQLRICGVEKGAILDDLERMRVLAGILLAMSDKGVVLSADIRYYAEMEETKKRLERRFFLLSRMTG